MKIKFFLHPYSHSRKELDPELNPDPLVRDADPQIWIRDTDPQIRIRTKMSRIPKIGRQSWTSG
jgi:hypothetical protein